MSADQKEMVNEKIEKRRLNYGLIKFVLGTFAVSVLSIALNWQMQQKRLRFEVQTKEGEYIAQFLSHGLEKELEKRRDFAAYFVRLSPTEEARQRWATYLQFVEDLIHKTKKNEAEIVAKDRQLQEAEKKIALLQAEAANKTEAAQATEQVESLRTRHDELTREIVSNQVEVAWLRSRPLALEFRSKGAQDTAVAFRAAEVSLPVTADNTASRRVTDGFWDWTVYLRGSDDILQRVEFVEYTLHETFPDPVRIVKERGVGPYAFALSTSGWGTFTIRIRITYKDGTYQRISYQLSFDESKKPQDLSRQTP